jgi:hypothetical protein
MNITSYLTKCILKHTPVSFSKYGDGEYYCSLGTIRHNCDYDSCTNNLQTEIKKSIKYMVEECDNSYIGLWHDTKNMDYWESLTTKAIRWAEYHTIIIDIKDMKREDSALEDKINLLKSIKNSSLKKIIVCNPLLVRATTLLNIQHMVQVPLRNWFDSHIDEIIQHISQVVDNQQFILITCCGMGAKVIISELSKKFPNGIFLDFGSALDLICTKRDSRGRDYSYDTLVEVLRDLLPEDWEDEKYNEVFEHAKVNMGVHLPN